MDDRAPAAADTRRAAATALPLIPIPFLALALVLAIVFAVGADWTDDDTLSASEGLPDLQQELAAHEWLLDRSDSSLTVDAGGPVTLVFGEDRVSGMGPCNSYVGRVSVDDDDETVQITDLAQTNRSCEETTMRAEDEYLVALQEVREVDLPDGYDQDRLQLSNDGGVRLTYDAVDVHELIVGAWSVVDVARREVLASVVVGTEPVLVFDSDGDLALDTGCNQVRGSFEVQGDRLFVDQLAQTLQECVEPAGVMDREAALVAALTSGAGIEVGPDSLTLLDEADAIVLIAVRDPAAN